MAYLGSVFAVPPALFIEKQQERLSKTPKKIERVRLSNPAFNIGFGNDVLLDSGASSFLATLISGIISEIRVPGLNFADPQPQTGNRVAQANEPRMSVVAIRYPSMKSLGLMGSCLTTFFGCDNEISTEFKITLPFAQDLLLSFNLPPETKVYLYHKDLPFLVITITPAGHAERLVISGANVQVNAKIQLNFFGVDAHSTDENLYKKIISALIAIKTEGKQQEMLETRLKVQMGHEVDFEAELNLPLYKIKNLVYKYLGLKGARTITEATRELELVKFKGDDFGSLSQEASGLSKLQTECIDGEAAKYDWGENLERNYRLATLDLASTALFFEESMDALEPGKEASIYLQLMNIENLPVCGLPAVVQDLTLVLIREGAYQPDIKLVSLFSCPVPRENEEFSFPTTFIPNASLFKANKVMLPYSGIYKVKLLYGQDFSEQIEIPHLSIYVRQ
jgi:hypothetical protein